MESFNIMDLDIEHKPVLTSYYTSEVDVKPRQTRPGLSEKQKKKKKRKKSYQYNKSIFRTYR